MGGGKRRGSVAFPEVLQKVDLKALSLELSLKVCSLLILLQLRGRLTVPAASSSSPFSPEHSLSLLPPSDTAQCPREIQRARFSPSLDLLAASDSVVHPVSLKNDGVVIFKLGHILSLHGILQAYKKEWRLVQ